MRKIVLIIGWSLSFVPAIVNAQIDTTSGGTLNQQRSTQFRTDTVTGQQGINLHSDSLNGSQQSQPKIYQPQNQNSQGTVSGSTPYDTTGMKPNSNYNSNDSTNYNQVEVNEKSGTQPTDDGSGNQSEIPEAGTSGTTGTGPTGASTSGAPGRPRYEGDASDAHDRATISNSPKKVTKKKKVN